MKSSVDLPMTTVNSGGIHTILGLMEKANFSLAEYKITKKLEKLEHVEWRRLDRETRHAERYDPCDDGSDFDDPEEIQLLPEDQTLLVHCFSNPLIGAVLSHGVKNEVDFSIANPAIASNTRPATPSLPGHNKRATAQPFSHFELRMKSCVLVSEMMKLLISDPTG
jgi:hypothetical protein